MNIGQGRPERPYQFGHAGAIGQRRTDIVTNLFVRRCTVCAPPHKPEKARQCHSEQAPRGPAAVGAQASKERSAEITSGRTLSQPGLATTCKDSPAKATTVGGERGWV